MSRRKNKTPRTIQSYIDAAKRLADFVPSLRKYKRRKTLTKYEKGRIAKFDRALRFTDHLIPLTKKQAREMRNEKFFPLSPERKDKSGNVIGGGKRIYGVQAIQLKDTSPNAKIKKINKDMIVTSNGRTWLYWKLEKLDKKNWIKRRRQVFGEAAKTYFTEPIEAFPIEKIERLVKHAFATIPKKKQVHLWTQHGRVGQGFTGINAFMDWLLSDYVRAYKDTDEWVNGIAILVYVNQ